jgi:putative MATE family efflux protein
MHTLTKNKVTKKYEMDMCSGSLLPKIIVFTLPLILSGMLQLMFNAADIVVAGRYVGEEALAAVGSTGSLVNLLVNVFMGVSIGTNVLVARYYGAGQKKDLEETVHTAILTAIIGGFCLIIIGFFVSRPILRWMDTPDNVIEGSVLYIRIYFGGMPFFMLYNFGSAILRAIGDTKRPTKYLLFAGVINVILNLIFVIAFKMSVAGVALATVISQAISAVLVLRCLVRSPGVYQVVLRNLRIIPNKFIKMLRIGIPAGIQGALFSISNVLIQSSVNSFGSTVMAGNMAAQTVEGFVYVAMNSFHQSAMSFTGQYMGAG